MQTIHIITGRNNNAMKLETTYIKDIACSGAQHIDDSTDLFIFDDTLQIGFSNIQWLALQFEHGLEFGETPLSSTSTCRISLDDKEFCARGIACITAQELFRERRIDSSPFFLLPARASSSTSCASLRAFCICKIFFSHSLPAAALLSNQSFRPSSTIERTIPSTGALFKRSFVCPWNWGLVSLTEITTFRPC